MSFREWVRVRRELAKEHRQLQEERRDKYHEELHRWRERHRQCELTDRARDGMHRAWHQRRRDEWRGEKEMWDKEAHRARWLPWWLQSKMRARIFVWMTLTVGAGIFVGSRLGACPRWWQILLGLMAL